MGRLIVIEGIDGAGKSTQVKLLAERLKSQGFTATCSREPTDGTYGSQIREAAAAGERMPMDKELFLFMEDRREHVRTLIRPALSRGGVVILDRYYPSTVAYQGARGLDPGWLQRQNELFAPVPDLMVVVDIPVEVALTRIRARGAVDAFETADALARSREIFFNINLPNKIVVDGEAGVETVSAAIWKAVEPLLEQLRATNHSSKVR